MKNRTVFVCILAIVLSAACVKMDDLDRVQWSANRILGGSNRANEATVTYVSKSGTPASAKRITIREKETLGVLTKALHGNERRVGVVPSMLRLRFVILASKGRKIAFWLYADDDGTESYLEFDTKNCSVGDAELVPYGILTVGKMSTKEILEILRATKPSLQELQSIEAQQ